MSEQLRQPGHSIGDRDLRKVPPEDDDTGLKFLYAVIREMPGGTEAIGKVSSMMTLKKEYFEQGGMKRISFREFCADRGVKL